jgi:hypothetical protein
MAESIGLHPGEAAILNEMSDLGHGCNAWYLPALRSFGQLLSGPGREEHCPHRQAAEAWQLYRALPRHCFK